MDALKEKMNVLIDSMKQELWNMGDDIFDHPEVALEEVYASSLLENWLESHGFQVERGLGFMTTAFRAVYEQGNGGPSIGLLCEYDALPGIGHACGHHLQGPCIAAAANAVLNAGIKEPFKLVVYGTPAEEHMAGKIKMIEEGCFKDIDVALMMHGSPTTTCDIKSMANYHIEVTFRGTSTHAAINPDKGRSALDGLILAFQGVEFLREHVRDDVRMHYTVQSTCNIPANVVSSKAIGSFILRSYNVLALDDVFRRFEKVIQGAALMTETTAEIKVLNRMASKIPALRLNDEIIKCAHEAGAPRISPPREKTGSTDLANVMELMPGSCIRVMFVPEKAAAHSQEYLDNGKSQTGHDAIIYGAKILAYVCCDLITVPGLMNEIQEDYEKQKQKMTEEA
ncbi:MAG: M20 family metallopeptidase [Lachnospiraceae bacterium]|nr:M20 family metallopeptidase [Lachnospiraceae bacterium]